MFSIPLDISEDSVLEDVAETARIARLPSPSDSSVEHEMETNKKAVVSLLLRCHLHHRRHPHLQCNREKWQQSEPPVLLGGLDVH